MTWYVATCTPRAEYRAESGLKERGVESYVPSEKHWVTHARRKTVSRRPIFPSYLFFQMQEGQSFYDVRSVDGITCIVGFNGSPSPIPMEWVYEIRESERAGFFDYTQDMTPTFRTNDAVRIIGGPFAGHLATIMEAKPGRSRVRVLLHMLGVVTKLKVDARQLRAA